MKKLSGTYIGSTHNSRLYAFFSYLKNGNPLSYFMALFLVLLFSGCSKQGAKMPAHESTVKTEGLILNSDDEFLNAYKTPDKPVSDARIGNGFTVLTFLELLEARAGTAKYRQFSKAIADGYADINVVVPNMGYHFMRSAIVDGVFEPSKPEILVYNKKTDGSFELVAVEYAVPIELTPNTAPEGFSGSADEWERNTTFGLWLQHAWVWQFNPEGVFNDTNPLVHVR